MFELNYKVTRDNMSEMLDIIEHKNYITYRDNDVDCYPIAVDSFEGQMLLTRAVKRGRNCELVVREEGGVCLFIGFDW